MCPLLQLRSSLSFEKVGKLDLLSHKLPSIIGAEILFGLLTADFCCAEVVNRVSLLEYLGHEPIPHSLQHCQDQDQEGFNCG